ncbi:MAG: hypothetical protein ACKVUT_00875 [Gaiella sp.]
MDVKQTPSTGSGSPAEAKPVVHLREGSQVVGRVVQTPAPGRDGLLALGGGVFRAKLPKGVRKGQKLALTVQGTVGESVVLERVRGKRGRSKVPARLVAALATQGDGDLLKVATGLARGPLQLPGRRLATIEPETDERPAGEASDGAVRFTLFAPALGTLEVSLRLDGQLLDAVVTTEPGASRRLAASAARGLVSSLEASLDARVRLSVVERRGPAPVPPVLRQELDEMERYA